MVHGIKLGLAIDYEAENKEQSPWDTAMASHIQYCRAHHLHFVCYPIGGLKRNSWRPTANGSELPPEMHLPDLQISSESWHGFVMGTVSKWIDPDASEPKWLAELSSQHLETELEYAQYLGLLSVTLRIKHLKSPRLASIVRKWLWKRAAHFKFIILLPTSIEKLLDQEEGNSESHLTSLPDLWSIWQDFRTSCGSYLERLNLGLELTANVDEEFYVERCRERWLSEQLALFTINPSIFMVDDTTSTAVLPSFHSTLITALTCSRSTMAILFFAVGHNQLLGTSSCDSTQISIDQLASTVNALHPYKAAATSVQDRFFDTIQAPITPLSIDLGSVVYGIFEQDGVKYSKYEEAVAKALKEIASHRQKPTPTEPLQIIAVVLGAGRGPLVWAIISAAKALEELNVKVKIWAVEKNRNACQSLEYANKTKWRGVVNILCCDMRKLTVDQLDGSCPDLVVSELLGSLGDNELAPECLGAVNRLLSERTVCIPSSYTSYLAPIHSLAAYHNILQHSERGYWESELPGEGRNGAIGNPFDRLYVANLTSCFALDSPQPCFTFKHPESEQYSGNGRSATLDFKAEMPCELTGFAGYFDTTLYGNMKLSTVPGEHTEGLVSWFPALLPLREPILLSTGSEMKIVIQRKLDSGGVWYEWFVEHRKAPVSTENDFPANNWTTTAVQNENGMSQYFPLS